MTATRLQLLMKKAEPSYATESPLLLAAYALYRDTETNENVAQLKWQNLDKRSVKAVMVVLITYNAFEQRLDDIQYQYDGLTVIPRKEFGSKLPIIIHDSRVSRFDVVLKAVSFVDGTVWRSDEDNIFEPLPKPVEQTLMGELYSQLKRDMKSKPWITKYTMQTMHDIWQCGCGNWQKVGMPCSKCHITQEELISATDPTLLQEHLAEYKAEVERLRIERQKQAEEARIERKKQEEEARILREQREAELAQQKAQQKALQKRRAIISGIVAAVVVALVAFVLVTQVIPSRKYNQAQALYDAQDYEAAYQIYASLSGYKDADSKITSCENEIAAKAAFEAKWSVGNYVTFGTYPQTKTGNDSTPIEWLVLDQDGSKALLISRYGLDAQPYNAQNASVTWETCTLRTWLNNTFLNKAFSVEEQAAILTTAVGNIKSQGYSTWNTDGGNNTQDKVFLLSYAEAHIYFSVTKSSNNNVTARLTPTNYAVAQGAYARNYKAPDGEIAGWWWLRSPGLYQNNAACVGTGGALSNSSVNTVVGCVRPAIWIDLDSGAVLISDNP